MGNSPVLTAPTKSGIAPDVLEGYFKSIQEPFRETREGMAQGEGPSGGFILGFVFCLIPVLPYAAYKLASWGLGPRLIAFHFLHINLTSFWFLWIALFGVSLTLLIVAAKVSGPSKDEKARWLSPQQMRFAYCYGIIDEIGTYKKNQLTRHIDKALDYLLRTAASLSLVPRDSVAAIYRELPPPHGEAMYIGDGTMIIHAGSRPKWYRLRPETELILKAYSELLSKLRDRLKDKKDLPAVESALSKRLVTTVWTE